jgi:hypothetical protein
VPGEQDRCQAGSQRSVTGEAAEDGPVAGRRRALVALCVTEITSWGTLYYAFPAMLASV